MQRTALPAPAGAATTSDDESVVVHVQLRPRRGSARKCLAALASLAAEPGAPSTRNSPSP